jgi:hypothetical protein
MKHFFRVIGLTTGLLVCVGSLVIIYLWFLRTPVEPSLTAPPMEGEKANLAYVQPFEIVGEWQIMAMTRNKTPVDPKKLKWPKYVFRKDGTYERYEDHGNYSFHPLARPDRLLKLYPKGPHEGECLTLKCEWEADTLRLTLDGPPIRDDEFETATLKRQK